MATKIGNKMVVTAIMLLCALAACKKKPEGEITVLTAPVSEITDNSAKCGGRVYFTGVFDIGDCGVCCSDYTLPTISDFFTEDQYGTGSFNSNLKNLKSNTTYYARAYARTSSGIIFGEQESFTTRPSDTWLYYGDNELEYDWGLIEGGTLTWAVMFPASMLTSYNGAIINKVRINVGERDTYTISIYQGGTDSPATLLISNDYSITSTGINTLAISPAITLDTSENLWIAVTNTHEAGEYPAGSSVGINNPNARWRCYDGEWSDEIYSNDGTDICWMIQAYLSFGTGKDGEEVEVLLPQPSNIVHPYNTIKAKNNPLHCKKPR